MIIINQSHLDELSDQARENIRLRKNLNIHQADDFCCHRLFNAIEPGSYLRPHRHLNPVKDETFLIVRGKLGVIMFDDNGNVAETILLSLKGDAIVADIPHGRFHAAVSLETGTIFFEAKSGPYLPLSEAETAPWSPEDGSLEANAYLEWIQNLFSKETGF